MMMMIMKIFNTSHDFRHWRRTLVFLLLLLVHSSALNSDGTILLSFKYSVLDDPLSVLADWNYADLTPCAWTGVTCAQLHSGLIGVSETFHVISLSLPSSQLLGSIPEDLGLLPNLRTLDLSNNFLNGTLPVTLFNSSDLQVLSLANNMIYGDIPEVAGESIGLKLLNLSDNALTGKIPAKLASLQNLSVLSLRRNYLTGSIPAGFGFVEVLDLSSNLFNGSLPVDFGGESLRFLNLSNNKLSGSVSLGFAMKIPANASMDLSFNNLTGQIPEALAFMNQETESFAGNAALCGKPLKKLCTIPSTLTVPPNITSSSTSSPAIAAMPRPIESGSETDSSTTQNGSGYIQQNKSKLKPGTIAGIAVGNLAGIGLIAMVILYVYQLKKKKRTEEINKLSVDNHHIAVTVKEDPPKDSKGIATWSCLSITNREDTSETTGSGSDSDENNGIDSFQIPNNENMKKQSRSLVMVDGGTELDLETLLKASAYILGSTGPSIVYKAVLGDGTSYAVRRIGDGEMMKMKEFERQVRSVAKMRHPNLVKIRGFYWGEDEKLVISDYVSNGSLATINGYRKMGSSPSHLSFQIRLKIAKGIARGLAYIHDKKHVHGNVKPSNILLTPEMEAVISDFGLDRLISGAGGGHRRSGTGGAGATRHFGSKRSLAARDDVSICGGNNSPYPAGFVGCTSPYHAPESLENVKPSGKWDVYSFGIVLLELLSGRVISDRELGQWTGGGVTVEEDEERVLRMADVGIRADVEGREYGILECFKLGFKCVSLVPQKRPSMREALHVLDKLPCSSSIM
ncbi:probable LRR receptor-like serine/threonine-protein kinase At4g37250 [Impatiens glandulifera]|uniref:probable LRR receptor-like serine/threonine-protein kinase At4g37250 n=1 Tax=Impatiens glandulifera TaxID=253017 RepID=UPI001FB09532|nr:probable LRR receptor-like serine/threonine-protein kinase At4g37250 [Impatiens glandulifera]